MRVDYTELARLMQAGLGEAKIRLNNAPGGLFGLLGGGSTANIGGTSFDIPLEPSSFNVAGTQVAYYVNDINSSRIQASAREGAVRIAITFESDGPELIGDCVAGLCTDAVLPVVHWTNPALNVDVVPIQANGSVALKVRGIEIGGQLHAVCQSGVGVVSGTFCTALRPAANAAINRVRAELPAKLRDKMNEPAMQAKIADGLRRYLTLGPAGEVRIATITSDAKGIVVSFKF